MKNFTKIIFGISLSSVLTFSTLLISVDFAAAKTSAKGGPPTALSQKELEKLVQPIALYPDLLLQTVLAASTFPEQILDAALYNEQGKSPEEIKNQPWDESVKGVANYPSVLTKLASDLDWTISLGSAFINQSEALRNAIQTLRSRAKAVGNLKDSEQQNVIEDKTQAGNTVIRIEPAQPEVVYVPTTTTTVYEQPVNETNLWAPVATFGLGMVLGAAMNDDDDDDNYYYGGGGYYGPGFWHGDDAINDWQDYRQNRWDDAYDYASDRQDWRQDSADDWREHRQDLTNKQQEWRQEQKQRVSEMSPEQRAQARSKTSTARSNWQSGTPEQRKQALSDRGVSKENLNQDRVNQAKANRSGSGSGTFSKTGSANYGNFDRESASLRMNQAKNNPDFQKRAESYKSSPQAQQRAQTARNNYQSGASQRSGSSYSRGSGFSGMSSSGYSANRTQARGSASRGYSGSSGFSRGGGGGGFSRGGGGGRGGGRR